MKTISAAQAALMSVGDTYVAAYPAEYIRVDVKDAGGTFRDLTTYGGNNFVDSVSWQEDLDSPHATATVTLKREIEQFSLAPLVQHSAYNRGFSYSAAYSALIALGREIKVYVAEVPADTHTSDFVSGNWLLVFHGYIDVIDPGGDSQMTLSCRDLGAKLMDAFIETERVYAFAGSYGYGRSMRVWEPNTVWALNEYVLPATRGQHTVWIDDTHSTVVNDPGRGYFYKCTTAGTGGTVEPVWQNATPNTDGGAAHTYVAGQDTSTAGVALAYILQQIITDCGVTAPLTTVGSPAWNISQFVLSRQGCLEGLRKLAMQIGWDVRYVWTAGAYELTLYCPDRVKATVDHTFNAKSWVKLSQFSTDISQIRNVVRVLYSDKADLWQDGTPKRKQVEVPSGRTSASITAYGIRFMEIAEDNSSQIDTSTEALRMANAALADLEWPVAAVSMELVTGFPWVELGDRYTLSAAVTQGEELSHIFSGDQTLSVYGYSHEATGGKIKTTVRMRGAPALGSHRWEAISSRGNTTGVHKKAAFQLPLGPRTSLYPTVGGAYVVAGGTLNLDSPPLQLEHHVSTLSNVFTPTTATLKQTSDANAVLIDGLIPGADYFYRSVPVSYNNTRKIRGEPSKGMPFTAGQAQAAHVNPHIDTSGKPLNGGFETYQPGRYLPDHWRLIFGSDPTPIPDTTTPGSIVTVIEDGSGVSGKRHVRFTPDTSEYAYLVSAQFTVTEGSAYRFSLRHKSEVNPHTGSWQAYVIWFDYTATPNDLEVGVVSSVAINNLAASTAWTTSEAVGIAPSGARVAAVMIWAPTDATQHYLDIDEVRVEEDKAMEPLEATIARTGLWNGKAASVYHIMGNRKLGWNSTSVMGDVAGYLDTSQDQMNTAAVGTTYYIISTSASDTNTAGTGARKVRVVYLDSAGDQQVATYNLNGTTAVSMGSGFTHFQWMEVTDVGTGTVAAGQIAISSVNGAPTVAQTLRSIEAGNNRSLAGNYKIPTGCSGYLTRWGVEAVGANMDSRLRWTVNMDDGTLSTVFHFVGTMYVPSGAVGADDLPYFKAPAGAEIKVSAIPSAAAAGNRINSHFHIIVVAD